MSNKLHFTFTSAFSGVTEETGAWQREEHDKLAKKFRAHIMSQPSGDGIGGMEVYRYGMDVEYVVEAISPDEVIAAVNEAVSWATSSLDKAFPLRGDKTPAAIMDTPVRRPSTEIQITAMLKTNLYALHVTKEQGEKLRNDFAAELLNCDGARDFYVAVNGVKLTIDTEIISVEKAKDHIQTLFAKHKLDKNSVYMPFVKEKDFTVYWSERTIMN